jgi:hypothetical protein
VLFKSALKRWWPWWGVKRGSAADGAHRPHYLYSYLGKSRMSGCWMIGAEDVGRSFFKASVVDAKLRPKVAIPTVRLESLQFQEGPPLPIVLHIANEL